MATSQEVKETYKSTLQDLTCNSKPHITVLTMLADENAANAKDIVEAIEEHLAKVRTDVKLPVLYLIDCIVKNVSGQYTAAFSANLDAIFTSVFQVVDEKTRMEMFKLRQTWNDVFPKSKLYALDVKTNQLDPAWPVTAPPPNIHFNPKFLNSANSKIAAKEVKTQPVVVPPAALTDSTFEMQQQYLIKQKQLLELQQKKLELELLQTQVKLQEQRKKALPIVKVEDATAKIATQNSLLIKPEVAKQLMSDKKNESAKAMLAHINQKFPIANSVLVAQDIPKNPMLGVPSARPPIRDPRLMRQAQQQPPAAIVPVIPSSNIVLPEKTNSNVDTNEKKTFVRESRFDTKDEPKKVLSRIPLKSKSGASPTKGKSAARHSKSSSGSTSSVDSPKKSSRSVSKSPSKSSGKYSKNKTTSRSSDKRPKRSDRRSPKKDKVRNYRRDRPISISPEHDEKKDVDLRVGGPPEKQARLGEPKNDKDMDLRNSSIGNKRLSSEISDGPSIKKNRAERFDTLFGSEDVDLRKLPTADVERPITPPAPIISNKLTVTEKENTNGSQEPAPKLSLEVLRAKLANATNANKDYLQNSRLKAQAEQSKQRLTSKKNDFITIDDDHPKPSKKSQETNFISKVLPIDNKKSQEAKRKENEVNLSNMMTTPISDDEFDSDVDKSVDDNVSVGGNVVPPKQSRFEPRFNNDLQWRGKRAPPPGLGRPMRGRANPWIRPPLQHGVVGNGPVWAVAQPPIVGPLFEEDLGAKVVGGGGSEAMGASPPSSQDDICMSHENIKSINIDGEPRDILFYGETAIAFMTPDDPREISFQAGQRRISFDDMHSYVLAFNDPYRDVLVGKHCHRVRLGAPTREVYIDGKPHECFFGGPPICVELDGKLVMVKIDGPSPQVKIGTVKRTDLVAGKVNLIIDAKTVVPIYLDARVQPFGIDGAEHTLRFKDRLKTVLINDVPMPTEFGGLPKGVLIGGRKHFIRFSVLPKGVRLGYVNIRDMDGNPTSEGDSSQDACDITTDRSIQVQSTQPRTRKSRFSDHSPDRSPQTNMLNSIMGNLGNLDNLLSIASTVVPTIPPHMGNYQIEQPPPMNNPPPIIEPPRVSQISQIPNLQVNTTVPPPIATQPPAPAAIVPPLNINDLFQKLVATGIVGTLQNQTQVTQPPPVVPAAEVPQLSPQMPKFETEVPPKVVHKPEVQIKPVSFSEPSSLKVRQSAIVHVLYSGMQCSSCGMRFPQENSSQYSQHLDWHFRQNRKGKTNIRKASSRRWYYSIADWNNYEEFEDLEEREKCYFDNQQKDQTEGKDEENEGEVEVPSVPADVHNQDPRCEVCQEKLEQFYNEEKEEWHLRNTIRIDDKTYHPLCYDDYQASLANVTADETMEQSVSNVSLDINPDVPMKEEPIGIPGLDVPPDEPVILDFDSISSTSKPNTPKSELHVDETSQGSIKGELKSETKTEDNLEDGVKTDLDDQQMDADDDVVINEVEPERIVLDDYEFDENGLIAGVVVKQEPIDDGFTDIENFHLRSPKVEEEPARQDESFMDIGEISEPAVPTSNNANQAVDNAATQEPRSSPPPDAAEAGHAAPASPAAAAADAVAAAATNAADCAAPEHTAIASAVGGNEPLLTVPSIDGNLDCNNAGVVPHLPTGGMGGKIKINISKPLPVIAPKENKDNTSDVDNTIEPIDPNQPLPPGEEPVQTCMKPALQGIDLKQLPPVNKGSELTGLCSIM